MANSLLNKREVMMKAEGTTECKISFVILLQNLHFEKTLLACIYGWDHSCPSPIPHRSALQIITHLTVYCNANNLCNTQYVCITTASSVYKFRVWNKGRVAKHHWVRVFVQSLPARLNSFLQGYAINKLQCLFQPIGRGESSKTCWASTTHREKQKAYFAFH